MILSILAVIYNILNEKFHWSNKEIDIHCCVILDYSLILISGLVMYAYFEILPAIIG